MNPIQRLDMWNVIGLVFNCSGAYQGTYFHPQGIFHPTLMFRVRNKSAARLLIQGIFSFQNALIRSNTIIKFCKNLPPIS